jgi:hypothetical protein
MPTRINELSIMGYGLLGAGAVATAAGTIGSRLGGAVIPHTGIPDASMMFIGLGVMGVGAGLAAISGTKI